MGRTLQPDDVLAHYRIIGPLGAGGMGEVYRARDTRLDRDVAIKVLPADLVRSEDRLRRFILEAKSASSLNHPHIVTIYEIGHEAVRPAAGSPGSADAGAAPVHYISMELVSGRTLKDVIHQEKADLRTVLGHLAQAAEGLSKAHAAGIVHRDLKPGNIMINRDGYAKVLDFGLAKLTEHVPGAGDITSAPTEAADRTDGGAMMGTVGYMSPEQVLGRPVDHRSDIFSFGCILYEAASRRRPFDAETTIDTMHRILHDPPAPLDALNPAVPAELRRLIRRCIDKNPDQRLQSIKDLAIELREIVDEFESLSATATSGSVVGRTVAPAPRRTGLWAAGLAALLGAGGLGFGLWALLGRDASRPAPFQSMRMSSIMTHTRLADAALSADGRYLAYVLGPAGQWSLWVRQVATGSDVRVLPPQPVLIAGIAFSPDGNYLYYQGTDPDTPNYRALFEVPSLGGSPRKRFFDVDTAVTFSPDKRKAAFIRGVPQEQASHLVVVDMEGGQESLLATLKYPESLPLVTPAWSPDGAVIVAVVLTAPPARVMRLEAFGAEDGSRRPLDTPPAAWVSGIGWLPGGRALAMTAEILTAASTQVWLVPYPAGPPRRITNDLDDYGGLSVSTDGAIEVLRFSSSRAIWSVAADSPGSEGQMTTGSFDGWIGDLSQAADGSIAFTAIQEGTRVIWTMAPDGSGRRSILPAPGWIAIQQLLADGRRTVFTHYGTDNVGHVWRADIDGGNLRRLTDGAGEHQQAVSPDGRVVLFNRAGAHPVLWKVSGEGGEPVKFLEGFSGTAGFSPDGKRLVYSELTDVGGRIRDRFVVIPAEGGAPAASFVPEGDFADVRWATDGEALTYIKTIDGVGNIWKQPASGGEPAQITRFSEGMILGRRHSPDGSRIALARRIGQIENLWTVQADGGRATQITQLKSGRLFLPFAWARDGRSLFFSHGELKQEVVLMRDLR